MTGLSHIYHLDGFNNTLLSQDGIFGTAPTVGTVGRMYFLRTGLGVRSLWLSRSSLRFNPWSYPLYYLLQHPLGASIWPLWHRSWQILASSFPLSPINGGSWGTCLRLLIWSYSTEGPDQSPSSECCFAALCWLSRLPCLAPFLSLSSDPWHHSPQ